MTIISLDQDCIIPDTSGRGTRAIIFGRICTPPKEPITLCNGHKSLQRTFEQAWKDRANYLLLRDADLRDKYRIENQIERE